MSAPSLLTFEPLFMERPWGGRSIQRELGIPLPENKKIGELWALVDRPEAQSIVKEGPLEGKTLHELWKEQRELIFGAKYRHHCSQRFPLLCKILDATETLSLQVHPSAQSALAFGGELKTEFWYFLKSQPNSFSYVGLKKGITREIFQAALRRGEPQKALYHLFPQEGDSILIPSGSPHALGGGNLVLEIQENSDTTYRLFDWNRLDSTGQERPLHLQEALASLDFEKEMTFSLQKNGSIISHSFHAEKWDLTQPRAVQKFDDFAIITCLTGRLLCQHEVFEPGSFFILPASLEKIMLIPQAPGTTILWTRLPN